VNANSDARITLANLQNTQSAGIIAGATYTGGPAFGAAGTVTAANGTVTFTGLPDPSVPQVYTVRLYSATGCFTDVQVTLTPANCCPDPTCLPVILQKINR
jgi:hypothetical protein